MGVRALRLRRREGLELHGWTPVRSGEGAPLAAVPASTGPDGGATGQAPAPWPGGDPFRAGGRGRRAKATGHAAAGAAEALGGLRAVG
eukprot:15429244-Alexandrium_andersonii.AAC.1